MNWSLVLLPLALLLFGCGSSDQAGQDDPDDQSQEDSDDPALTPVDRSETNTGAPDPGLGSDVDGLVSYLVDGQQITEPTFHSVSSRLEDLQQDSEAHEQIWLFALPIYEDNLQRFSTFVIFTDGPDEALASVFRTAEDGTRWCLAIDIADAWVDGELNQQDLRFSLIHELAHVLALNDEQVPVDDELFGNEEDADLFEDKRSECRTLFLDEGCAKADSYINLFYEDFWRDHAEEFDAIDAIDDPDERDEAVFDFYDQYSDEFVSDYAATNVTEDFAESFTTFVLSDAPNDDATLAKQKQLFFSDFPEFVELRQSLRRTF